MAIDLEEVIRAGDRMLIDFLDYCVRSMQLEPVFIFLVREYQNNPTIPRALALYDVFCEPKSVARIKVDTALPPRNMALLNTVTTMRDQQQQLEQAKKAMLADPEAEHPPVRYAIPMKNMFDQVVQSIKNEDTDPLHNPLHKATASYDPTRTPAENLPDGQMNRHFVDYIWGPQIRPFLITAGFRRIANIA